MLIKVDSALHFPPSNPATLHPSPALATVNFYRAILEPESSFRVFPRRLGRDRNQNNWDLPHG
jgi:hypothetical protein